MMQETLALIERGETARAEAVRLYRSTLEIAKYVEESAAIQGEYLEDMQIIRRKFERLKRQVELQSVVHARPDRALQ